MSEPQQPNHHSYYTNKKPLLADPEVTTIVTLPDPRGMGKLAVTGESQSPLTIKREK